MKDHHLFTLFTGLACGVLSASLLSLNAAPAQPKHGTDILHFSASETMQNASTALPDASGRIALRNNEQGKVTVQSLDIIAEKLAPSTVYAVVADFVDGTSAKAADVTTDANGNLKIRYRQVTHNGRVNKLGRGQTALPTALSNLAAVRKLHITVEDPAATPPTFTDVLVADLSTADRLQYLVKRDLSTDTVRATLRIVANAQHAQFRLSATGLTPATQYTLALSDGVAEETSTELTDAKGRLAVQAPIEPALDLLKLRKVELRTVATAPDLPVVVLTTNLP